MSQYSNKPPEELIPREVDKKATFTIRDTDFLLKIISSTNIPGNELNQAMDTVTKLREIHNVLSNKEETVV